ncbi:MAG: hypothetical protein Q9207_006346 [Kuettlingeria erythrocarpa]
MVAFLLRETGPQRRTDEVLVFPCDAPCGMEPVTKSSAEAIALVHDLLRSYSFDLAQRDDVASDFASDLTQSSDRMVDYLMRFQHQEKQPDPSRPVVCGTAIGLGYAIGGLIPLITYLYIERHDVMQALWSSVDVVPSSFPGLDKPGLFNVLADDWRV